MGMVLDFEIGALASLKRRIAGLESANRKLAVVARGHPAAAAAIHRAALAAIDADGLEHLVHIVTHEWPDLLALDAVALALYAGERGLRADVSGLHAVDRREIEAFVDDMERATAIDVMRGHPLFGPASSLIRAEAHVPFDMAAPSSRGLILLGRRGRGTLHGCYGAEPLRFLGDLLSRALGRWLVC